MMRKTLLAAGLGLALVAAGCGTQSDTAPRASYPPETRTNFIDNCVAAATKSSGSTPAEARKTCTCVVDKLQTKLPYRKNGANNDYKDADTLIRDGKPLPATLKDPIDQATADCRPNA
jgi:hypothetical protein